MKKEKALEKLVSENFLNLEVLIKVNEVRNNEE